MGFESSLHDIDTMKPHMGVAEKLVLRQTAGDILEKLWTINIDFVKEYKLSIRHPDGTLKGPCELDVIVDVLDIDIGRLYQKLSSTWAYDEVIPFACSVVGANMSESFCEREVSIVGQIISKRRTRLSDEMVEMLTVLRMNAAFMQCMSEAFPTLALRLNNDHRTVLKAVVDSADATVF